MNLDEAQRNKVAAWIADGAKLSDIQTRLASELGLKFTYMEVRLLVDDLKLTPKDPEPPKNATAPAAPQNSGLTTTAAKISGDEASPPPGKVSVSLDQLTRPGSIASGKVTFSDSQTADWYLDQTGRLGLVPKQPGYKPSAADVQQFQTALQGELARMGF